MNKIRVLVKRPELAEPSIEEIEPSNATYHKIVGGYIEGIRLGRADGSLATPNVFIYLNEEGKLLRLPPNVMLPNGDILVGAFVFVGVDEEGNDVSLTDDEVKACRAWLKDDCREVI